MKESGVLDKTIMVFGQMNETSGARMRAPLTGLTMAEYLRDEKHRDVLLFIDNIYRFVQAGSEVSALLGRIPSAVGYQPTLTGEVGELQERITSTRNGSITSIQAVYVPADDITDPAPATTFAHLDAKAFVRGEGRQLGKLAYTHLGSGSRLFHRITLKQRINKSIHHSDDLVRCAICLEFATFSDFFAIQVHNGIGSLFAFIRNIVELLFGIIRQVTGLVHADVTGLQNQGIEVGLVHGVCDVGVCLEISRL